TDRRPLAFRAAGSGSRRREHAGSPVPKARGRRPSRDTGLGPANRGKSESRYSPTFFGAVALRAGALGTCPLVSACGACWAPFFSPGGFAALAVVFAFFGFSAGSAGAASSPFFAFLPFSSAAGAGAAFFFNWK